MIKTALQKLIAKENLHFDDAYASMTEILRGKAEHDARLAYLSALSTKCVLRKTVDEIAGSAAALRDSAPAFPETGDVLDIVGTGGTPLKTFNVSTASAILCAAAGARVAKQCSPASISKSGSADCLRALGANLELPIEEHHARLLRLGLCAFSVESTQRALQSLADIRALLGRCNLFRLIEPLANPAKPVFLLFGVYDASLLEPVARILMHLGIRRAMVVYGQDGMDEISMSAPTAVCELDRGDLYRYILKPEDFNLPRANPCDLAGGSAEENAQILRNIFSGSQGPQTDLTLLNAGAALYVSERAKSITEGIHIARKTIAIGAVLKKLEELCVASDA